MGASFLCKRKRERERGGVGGRGGSRAEDAGAAAQGDDEMKDASPFYVVLVGWPVVDELATAEN